MCFRIACEKALMSMKINKEEFILLDPLVNDSCHLMIVALNHGALIIIIETTNGK
jgi:hypothetical protein